ncbi:A24 family peptidase [Anaerobaca lacustris]|uniref:A24 family peptidase n=1 Tax=Anaerobaca lacustris TaxID=3044600 RepID=A0AAW6U815_9BACT|nr:A24 family peptidase [Sedimentisphaerales bacterium M17dextr]
MIETGSFQWGIAIAASLVAAVSDVRSRRIPNALTVPVLASGLVFSLIAGGLSGLGDSLLGCVVMGVPYVLLFLLGGGAGDAKMMGALGAWLGFRSGVTALVAVAIIGGVFGLLRMLADRNAGTRLGTMFSGMYLFLLTARLGKKDWDLLRPDTPTSGDDEKNESNTAPGRRSMIPYGPAIFLGVCIGALVVHLWQG